MRLRLRRQATYRRSVFGRLRYRPAGRQQAGAGQREAEVAAEAWHPDGRRQRGGRRRRLDWQRRCTRRAGPRAAHRLLQRVAEGGVEREELFAAHGLATPTHGVATPTHGLGPGAHAAASAAASARATYASAGMGLPLSLLHSVEEMARLTSQEDGRREGLQQGRDGAGGPEYEPKLPMRLGVRSWDRLVSVEQKLARAIVDAPVAYPALHAAEVRQERRHQQPQPHWQQAHRARARTGKQRGQPPGVVTALLLAAAAAAAAARRRALAAGSHAPCAPLTGPGSPAPVLLRRAFPRHVAPEELGRLASASERVERVGGRGRGAVLRERLATRESAQGVGGDQVASQAIERAQLAHPAAAAAAAAPQRLHHPQQARLLHLARRVVGPARWLVGRGRLLRPARVGVAAPEEGAERLELLEEGVAQCEQHGRRGAAACDRVREVSQVDRACAKPLERRNEGEQAAWLSAQGIARTRGVEADGEEAWRLHAGATGGEQPIGRRRRRRMRMRWRALVTFWRRPTARTGGRRCRRIELQHLPFGAARALREGAQVLAKQPELGKPALPCVAPDGRHTGVLAPAPLAVSGGRRGRTSL